MLLKSKIVCPRVKEIVSTIHDIKAEINLNVVGRIAETEAILLAIMSKNHVLMQGPPGVAKSYLAQCVFEHFKDAEVFNIQCTKRTSENAIIGPPNTAILRDEGRFWYNTESMMPECDMAFVDEIMDLSDDALRSMLSMLNERKLIKGPQQIDCPLWSAVTTTNFNRDDEESLAAVYDRFLFRINVKPLGSKSARMELLKMQRHEPTKFLSMGDLEFFYERAKKVTVPEAVLEAYIDILSSMEVTDRKAKKALEVLQVRALAGLRSEVRMEDLAILSNCLAVLNDSASMANYLTAYKRSGVDSLIQAEVHAREDKSIARQVRSLDRSVRDLLDEDVKPTYSEVEELAGSLNAAVKVYKDTCANLDVSLVEKVEYTLTLVDGVYNGEL